MSTYNAVTWLLDRNVDEGRGQKLAFTDTVSELSYGDLQRQSRRAANLMRRLGVRREERVAMIMLDTVDFPIVFLGAIRAGVVPVPLNTLLTADQYAYVLADSRARVLFVSEALYATVKDIVGRMPDLECVVVSGKNAFGHKLLSEELARESDAFATVETHAEEPAFWLYSSGSTGAPKGAKHVHSSLIATAKLYAEGVLGFQTNDVVYSAAKLFFAYGLGNAMTFPMAVGASAVLLPDRPTPEAVLDIMRRHEPTIFFGVPTLYAALLARNDVGKGAGSDRLRLCVSAGEALPEHIGKRWKEVVGLDVLDGIGSTEMLHIFLSNRADDIRYGTTGKPVPGYEARIVAEDGRELPAGEVGELIVRGPSAAEGYWNQRAKSQRTFVGEWTWTGDKYIRDADGYYQCCGRTDDMFKVSGIWVSPFEVEAALVSHDAVLEAAVIAREDEEGLLKPKAFVVLKSGHQADESLFDALKEHVKARAGPWKYPRWIDVRGELPKTATGKIQRFKLREEDAAVK
jgi:4-hydroxybenzoate-CoA ligase